MLNNVHDPREGVTPEGLIRTGATRRAIDPLWVPVLSAAVEATGGRAPLYVYGSVATGCAVVPTSDVDLLTVGLPEHEGERVSADLSTRFGGTCREVSVGAASVADVEASTEEGYGLRVFLRHYCVHLAGDDPAGGLPAFPADVRAARGFNGDIARHLERWKLELEDDADAAHLGKRIARKTLLAVSGLVSMRDATWSTDRRGCAARWDELEPCLPVDALVEWLDSPPCDPAAVRRALKETVAPIVDAFESEIGLWATDR